jgi:hypothetical protein
VAGGPSLVIQVSIFYPSSLNFVSEISIIL